MVQIGDVIDDYQVVAKLGRHNQQTYFKMKCLKCGHEKECGSSNINRQDNSHSWANCGFDYYKELEGQLIDDYIVESITKLDSQYIANIKCVICGHKKQVAASELYTIASTKHSAFGCHEDYWNSLIGKQFGDLIVESLGDCNPVHRTLICRCVKCGTKMERMCNSIINMSGVNHGTPCIKAIPDSDYKRAIVRRFANIADRCNNPHNAHYDNYGGRGIKLMYEHVVDFYYDYIDELIEHAKKHGLRNSTFDRIDVDRNYEKGNIRVATQFIQSTNTTRRKFFLAKKDREVVLCDSSGEFARYCQGKASAVGNAVRKALRGIPAKTSGWTVEKAWIDLTEEEIKNIIVTEGVTTKLLITI